MDENNSEFPRSSYGKRGTGSRSIKKVQKKVIIYKISPKGDRVVQFDIGPRHFTMEPGTSIELSAKDFKRSEVQDQLKYIKIQEV